MSSSRLSNSNISDADTNTTRYWDCGDADHRCQHCQVVLWYEERSVKWYNPHNPKFSVYCGNGKVKLDYMREPPALLTVLDINDGHRPYTFHLNGHNHHRIGSLFHTHVDGRPQFSQL
ncbi:hypothetical protein Tco_0142242, partial [Tanacetum coccineum]